MSQDREKAIVVTDPRMDIAISESGNVNAKNLQELWNFSTVLKDSGILPQAFNTTSKIVSGLLYLKELKLPVMTSFRQLAVINGSPSLWGELPLSLVRSSGLLEWIKEYFIDKNYNTICLKNKNLEAEIFAAVCIVKRKNAEEREFVYTAMDAAKNPNSTDPKNFVWRNYRSVMMKRKARSLALKDEFGDIIGGVGIAEYDDDTFPTDSKPIFTEEKPRTNEATNDLNKRILSKTTSEPVQEATVITPEKA